MTRVIMLFDLLAALLPLHGLRVHKVPGNLGNSVYFRGQLNRSWSDIGLTSML
jgi:hypothetical protein